MITCAIFRRHLDAIVDGEVDPTAQIEFEQHLAECGSCRLQLSFAEAFKRDVKNALLEGATPPSVDLAARIGHALDDEDARRAGATGASGTLGSGVGFLPLKARYLVPAAVAAMALVVVAAYSGLPLELDLDGSRGASAAMTGASYIEDVVDRHWREHPAEISGPPTQVASWFRGKLEFPVRPMEFQSPDVRLVGARISNVQDREAAAFYYDVNGQRVTVLVFEPQSSMSGSVQHTSVEGRGIYYGQAHGYTVPVVEHDGLTYAIAGDLDARSLLQLAASARVADR